MCGRTVWSLKISQNPLPTTLMYLFVIHLPIMSTLAIAGLETRPGLISSTKTHKTTGPSKSATVTSKDLTISTLSGTTWMNLQSSVHLPKLSQWTQSTTKLMEPKSSIATSTTRMVPCNKDHHLEVSLKEITSQGDHLCWPDHSS